MTDNATTDIQPVVEESTTSNNNVKKKPMRDIVAPTSNDVTKLSLSVDIKADENESRKNYFVRLPHSAYEFNVRGLTVEEEDEIKSSNTSTKRAAETIMKVLYNCISSDIKKPDHPFGRYDTFIKSISQADRDALALAVIEQTYESTHEMLIRCGRCNKTFTEEVCLPDCMHYEFYQGEEPILQKRKILEFPELKWKLYLKIPTLADELKTLNTNEKAEDLQKAAEFIYIDKIEFISKDSTTGTEFMQTFDNYVAIYGMIKKKPAIIRKRIEKEYRNFRGDYGVTGSYETSCKYCDNPIQMNIIPISHFLYLVQ